MDEKEKLVDRDLHLFEAINEGKGEHLQGSESCLLYTSDAADDP